MSAPAADGGIPVSAGGRFRAEWESHLRGHGPAIDPQVLAELDDLTGDDDAFLADVLYTYREQAASLVAKARAAAASGEMPVFVRALHTLNGSSRSVGALRVARLCAAIEIDARTAPPPPSLAFILDLLEEPLHTACAALLVHLQRAREKEPGG